MKRLLKRLLDPEEFLGDHGIRSISKYRAHHPYVYQVNGTEYTVRYEPTESESGVFGGNSNWRGPIWFPINYLLIEALQKFHHYYGDDFLVECPTGSGTMLTLWQIAEELSCRLTHIFLRDPSGRRPVFGSNEVFQTDPHWHDYLLFHEYFHGDSGAGPWCQPPDGLDGAGRQIAGTDQRKIDLSLATSHLPPRSVLSPCTFSKMPDLLRRYVTSLFPVSSSV
jgi:Glycosyl hydrolase family 63 C-terminal domain